MSSTLTGIVRETLVDIVQSLEFQRLEVLFSIYVSIYLRIGSIYLYIRRHFIRYEFTLVRINCFIHRDGYPSLELKVFVRIEL